MDEAGSKGDLHGNLFRQGPNRSPLSLKTSFSGKSSPRNSPTFRRLGSSRTPRRDSRTGTGSFVWIRNNKVVFWLILITLWAYIGFHVQSQWAHGDHNKAEFVGYKSESHGENATIKATGNTTDLGKERLLVEGKKGSDSTFGVNLVQKVRKISSQLKSTKKKGQRPRKLAVKPKEVAEENQPDEMEELNIPRKNTSYGLIVGPFGKTEDSVLEWNPEKRRGTCNRKGDFAHLVWSRRFVLVFHELSMTGAPLSMLELATEILSCGGYLSAIILSRKGGLMGELERRGIKVLHDREKPSFKVAMKADLIIAGSAVCSSWIEPYLGHFPAGAGQIVWWIMENRREYFDRSKHLINRVKMLTFLSESQSKQWLSWCEEENIKFYLQPMLVPLSVNDELAFVAGLPCSLNAFAQSPPTILYSQKLYHLPVARHCLQIVNYSDSPISNAWRFVLDERRSTRWRIQTFSSSDENFDGSLQGEVSGELSLDAILSVTEILFIIPPALYYVRCIIGFLIPGAVKPLHASLGSNGFVWQFLLLVGSVAIGSLIRRRQWGRICRESDSGVDVNLLARIEKVEEDLRSSATIVRVLSRQLEKLGIRFRVTRKALKEPITETAALAQKNSEAMRALALQADILEKELGEIQKVLLAMQVQQQKQLELILAIVKACRLLDNKHDTSFPTEQGTTGSGNSATNPLSGKNQRKQLEIQNDRP